jgi:hypothetical protein
MAYPMNALDWYRKNRSGLVGFGGFNGFGDFGAFGGDTISGEQNISDNPAWSPSSCLVSNDGRFAACLSGGNFYIHKHADPALQIVKVIGGGGQGHYLRIKGGNLVLEKTPGWGEVWHSGGSSGVRLVMQDDGNLVVYRANGSALWASNTAGTSAPYPQAAAPPPPPPPPPGPTPEEIRQREAEIRQREAEERARLSKIEADRQKALADKAQADKLQADRDAAKAKLDADQALIDASRNAADLQKQLLAQQALDELAAADAKKAAADLEAAKAEAAAYEASLKAEQAKGGATSTSTVLTGQSLAPPSAPPSSGPSPLLYVGLAALGALLLLKKKG